MFSLVLTVKFSPTTVVLATYLIRQVSKEFTRKFRLAIASSIFRDAFERSLFGKIRDSQSNQYSSTSYIHVIDSYYSPLFVRFCRNNIG